MSQEYDRRYFGPDDPDGYPYRQNDGARRTTRSSRQEPERQPQRRRKKKKRITPLGVLIYLVFVVGLSALLAWAGSRPTMFWR